MEHCLLEKCQKSHPQKEETRNRTCAFLIIVSGVISVVWSAYVVVMLNLIAQHWTRKKPPNQYRCDRYLDTMHR